MSGTIKCLKATFDERQLGSYELRIQAKAGDETDWSRHEGPGLLPDTWREADER